MTGGPSPWLGESLEAFMRKPAPPATLPETPQSVAVPPAVVEALKVVIK